MKFRKRDKGFTLIEILVVIIILAILSTAIVATLHNKPDEARVSQAKADISTMESQMEVLRMEMGRYLHEEEGLEGLAVRPDSDDAQKWNGPYIKRLNKDPWGNPYVYLNPGVHNPDGFDILSYGADGQEGGTGSYDRDIGNWIDEEAEAVR